MRVVSFQIGKSGVNSGAINALSLALKNHKFVRVSALKSSGRNRDSIKAMAHEIISKLPFSCTYKIIGFTIVLRKHKKVF